MSEQSYFTAIERGDTASLRELLEHQPRLLEARTSPAGVSDQQMDCSGLHMAIYARQPEVARMLIDAGIDIKTRTTGGRTALHDSIEFGCTDVTRLLLERGAEVDICTAAILGRLERVRELLDRDPQLANDRSTGLSPLGWAAFGNQVETAEELIDHGARMDDGELLCAASVGHVEVGQLLIERGVDPDEIRSDAGGNALHAAAAMKYAHDSRPFIEMLLEAGADRNARTTDGRTALQIAEEKADRQSRDLANKPSVHPKRFEEVTRLLRGWN